MQVSLQEKKEEGIYRMKEICDTFGLGDKLVDYLKADRLYYSYSISMDTIDYDKRYADIVKEFESERSAYVYHVIETKLQSGVVLLSLLFVSDHKEDWITEKLEKNSIFAYSCDIEDSCFGDMGWIYLDARYGYLMRIG